MTTKIGYAIAKGGEVIDIYGLTERFEGKLPPRFEGPLTLLLEGYPDVPDVFGSWVSRLQTAYDRWERRGPFGDLIQFTYDAESEPSHLQIVFIAPLAFPKPTLAADLVPFIVTPTRIFFVGILRGREPGIGKPALIGGIRILRGLHLQLPVENLGDEGPEEAGISIALPPAAALHPYECADPYPASVNVNVSVHGLFYAATTLVYLGSRMTGAAEVGPDGESRVHETAGYGFVARTDEDFSREKLLAALAPTDTEEGMTVFVEEFHRDRACGEFASELERVQRGFHSAHHRDLFRTATSHFMTEFVS